MKEFSPSKKIELTIKLLFQLEWNQVRLKE